MRWLGSAVYAVVLCAGPAGPAAGSELRMQDLEQRIESLERALREAARPQAGAMPRREIPPPRPMETLPHREARLRGDARIDPRRDRHGLLLRARGPSSAADSAERPTAVEWTGSAAPPGGVWSRASKQASGFDAGARARLVKDVPVVRIGPGGPSMEEVLEAVTLEDVNRFVFRRNRAEADGLPTVRAGGE